MASTHPGAWGAWPQPVCLRMRSAGSGLGSACMPPALACLRVRTSSLVLALVQQLGRVSTFLRRARPQAPMAGGMGPQGTNSCCGRGLGAPMAAGGGASGANDYIGAGSCSRGAWPQASMMVGGDFNGQWLGRGLRAPIAAWGGASGHQWLRGAGPLVSMTATGRGFRAWDHTGPWIVV